MDASRVGVVGLGTFGEVHLNAYAGQPGPPTTVRCLRCTACASPARCRPWSSRPARDGPSSCDYSARNAARP